MAKQKVTGIKKDAQIKITVSAGFYFRLAQLVVSYTSTWTSEELQELMLKLKDTDPTDEKEYHLVTLVSLVNEIESKAKEQDLLITEELDLESIRAASPEN